MKGWEAGPPFPGGTVSWSAGYSTPVVCTFTTSACWMITWRACRSTAGGAATPRPTSSAISSAVGG